jgi:hypothetical protein
MTGGKELAGAGFQFAIIVVFAGAALGFYLLYRNLMKGQRLGDRRQPTDRRDTPQ